MPVRPTAQVEGDHHTRRSGGMHQEVVLSVTRHDLHDGGIDPAATFCGGALRRSGGRWDHTSPEQAESQHEIKAQEPQQPPAPKRSEQPAPPPCHLVSEDAAHHSHHDHLSITRPYSRARREYGRSPSGARSVGWLCRMVLTPRSPDLLVSHPSSHVRSSRTSLYQWTSPTNPASRWESSTQSANSSRRRRGRHRRRDPQPSGQFRPSRQERPSRGGRRQQRHLTCTPRGQRTRCHVRHPRRPSAAQAVQPGTETATRRPPLRCRSPPAPGNRNGVPARSRARTARAHLKPQPAPKR